jgi:hypothetical protein
VAAKVKLVQSMELKDKKIAHEVIEQIRKPIPASVYKRHEKSCLHWLVFQTGRYTPGVFQSQPLRRIKILW